MLIVGDGEQRKKLVGLANRLNISAAIHFLGFQKHSTIPRFIAACDVFVRPSLDEGFGIVFLEAMACEKPTIATKVGGITDIITDEETGILVPPKDPKELSKAIIRMFSDKVGAKMLAKKGRLMVKDRFTWRSVVAQLNKVYQILIDSST